MNTSSRMESTSKPGAGRGHEGAAEPALATNSSTLFGEAVQAVLEGPVCDSPPLGCIHMSEATYALLAEDQRCLFQPTGGVDVKVGQGGGSLLCCKDLS